MLVAEQPDDDWPTPDEEPAGEVADLLPEQILPHGSHPTGEHRLLLAVLVDALWLSASRAPAPGTRQDRQCVSTRDRREAAEWLAGRRWRGGIALEDVCDALHLDADVIRRAAASLPKGWRHPAC